MCLMISKLPLKMANNMLMLKIYPNIVVFRLLQFSILNHRAIVLGEPLNLKELCEPV